MRTIDKTRPVFRVVYRDSMGRRVTEWINADDPEQARELLNGGGSVESVTRVDAKTGLAAQDGEGGR